MTRRLSWTALGCLFVLWTNPVLAQITSDAVKQTKQATVYLKVTTASGKITEGSGFLAVRQGIVITNAHVVGMMQASSKPPSKVEVVLYSGEADEVQLAGEVLGVDRANDLAVLRVDGKLPAPLQLGLKDELFETQKVYIFGFPFGAQLGKNITVSESSVSSLRKGAGGVLERIQVNGGMHPGNSGGPVVNAQGQVVGVAVAGINNTQIHFAIPAATVKALLDGCIQQTKSGELFRNQEEVRVPLQLSTLDPLDNIREIRVEVWAGDPASKRTYSPQKALPLKGDGPRLSYTLKFAAGGASADVLLPKLTGNQVAWVQPVLVLASGEAVWSQPIAYDAALAVERLPADLLVKLAQQKERTVHLKCSQAVIWSKGKARFSDTFSAELDVLESFAPGPKGAQVRVGFGWPALSYEQDGKKAKMEPQVANVLQRIPPRYVVDETNKLQSRTTINLNPKMPKQLREQVEDYLMQICNAYEAGNFILPNRKLQAGEAWPVQLPMLIKMGDKTEVIDLVLTCTYEGVRTRAGTPEALVTFQGTVRGRGKMKDRVNGQVTGKFTYDNQRAFISSVKITISSEAEANDVQTLFEFHIDLTRVDGNPLNIALPKDNAVPPAKGEILLTRNGALTATDPLDKQFGGRGSRMHLVAVLFEQGKKYTILLNSDAFDSYLRLIDPTGKIVAEDDDGGGGLNSRIDHTAAQTGQYRIIVTSFDGKLGAYQLKILGEKGSDVGAKEDAAKGFARPNPSKEPTSYLKIASPPGDYIGQGKNYEYTGKELTVKLTPQSLTVQVDGWSLDLSGPRGQALQVGEYSNAKRYPFHGDSPGLSFAGKGRGSNKVAGAFVVWELEIDNGQIMRAAIDFVQRDEETGPPLVGKLRINSKLE
jgi:S1-C subfamily serine protease